MRVVLAAIIAALVLPALAQAEIRRDVVIPDAWRRPECADYRILDVRDARIDLFDLNFQRLQPATREQILAAGQARFCSDDGAFALVTLAGAAVLVRFDDLHLDLPQAAPSAPEREEATRGLGPARDRVLTPVLSELMPNAARAARNGGSASVLLARPYPSAAARRNLILCQALFSTFDQATAEEIARGARIGAEGDLELLRPIYWLTRTLSEGAPGADHCPERLGAYDYPRRDVLARKYNLPDAGPYLVIEDVGASQSEHLVGVIDLSNTPESQIPNAVDYFRNGFMQAGDVWRPDRYAPARARGLIAEYFGARSRPTGFLPQLIRASSTLACPLANLFDVCATNP